MWRGISILFIASICTAFIRAQELTYPRSAVSPARKATAPLSSFSHAKSPFVEIAPYASCATKSCGTCQDCVRISEIKKKQSPVYSCQIKEICIPSCGLFGSLFGQAGECRKIEVRQLVKKLRTDEECVSKCVTHEEAVKRAASK